jgi:transposase InsO family protein
VHYSTRFSPEMVRLGIKSDREAGLTVMAIRKKYQVSRNTVRRWVRRADPISRSSRPRLEPRRMALELEARILAARADSRRGPNMLSAMLGIPASTIYKVLRRHGISRLFPKEKLPSTRYEHDMPGSLVHVDVKKLGRIGLCADSRKRRRFQGHECLHLMIDDCTRLGYAEIHPSETAWACTASFERGVAWFASLGITVQRVLTDRGAAYTSHLWRDISQLQGIRHQLIRPRRPQTNGKCERWIRTIVDECLRGQAYGDLEARAKAIQRFVNYYNTTRPHMALDGKAPFQKLFG